MDATPRELPRLVNAVVRRTSPPPKLHPWIKSYERKAELDFSHKEPTRAPRSTVQSLYANSTLPEGERKGIATQGLASGSEMLENSSGNVKPGGVTGVNPFGTTLANGLFGGKRKRGKDSSRILRHPSGEQLRRCQLQVPVPVWVPLLYVHHVPDPVPVHVALSVRAVPAYTSTSSDLSVLLITTTLPVRVPVLSYAINAMDREHEALDTGILLLQDLDTFDAAPIGHADVHQYDVGASSSIVARASSK